MTDATASAQADERVRDVSALRRALIRPELGGICGTILVFLLFASIAGDSGMFGLSGVMNWTTVSAQFMIIAVGACLLMIAGEFDLSVGSMIGFSGMLMAIFSVHLGLPMWSALLLTFAICTVIGGLNGWLVIKTGLPSFIVTLASLYILRGATIWGSIYFTRQTIISGVGEKAEGDWLAWLFGGKVLGGLFTWMGNQGWIDVFTRGNRAGQPVVDGIPMLIVWAVGLAILGHWLLTRTKTGNWIFAAGGDKQAALYVGVPVARVKIAMFMVSAFCATVFAACQVMEFGSAAADRGLLKEFEAIICVVIGGALLTGGYGSVIGAALGAIIFGVVQQGLFFANAESSLFRVFLGVILLVAVIMNTYIRRIITGER
ncbi:ABC transporter permease [Mangrovicoccus sp. HB161399]|uniref:ABC transporter permease n=1 Tax=Mangrovicoccus sp. HB161399 TaxID=2720392 RepID=UPI0015569FD2|nr:ABC transporter permease [Mangrovicoccus sp. HB161399]